MAATDTSESPKRQKSPAEEVETSGQKSEVVEPGCITINSDETTANKSTEGPGEEERVSVGIDDGPVASHSEVSVESGAGTEKTTCISPDDVTTDEKITDAPGSDERAFDCSETVDNEGEATTLKQENDKCDPNNITKSAGEVQQDADNDSDITADADEILEEEYKNADEKSTDKELAKEPVVEIDDTEDVVEDDEEGSKEKNSDVTAKPKKGWLVCKDCGKAFNRRETFNLHRHFHTHADELTPLTCKECGLTFEHRSNLIKHRYQHKDKEEQLLIPKRELGSFKCAGCERVFCTVDKLRDHNCFSTVEKPYHCPLCRQDFQFKVSVTKHMASHSQECIFRCQECSQTFPNSMALRYHQRCHTALKPYKCPECGMVFKHYSVMEDHRRRHTGNTRSHLCNICGKSFKYSSLLHQHQYLHTGQKPFRCPECGKKFAFAQNMKAHCRQHRLHEINSSTERPSKQPALSTPEPVRGPGKENTHQSEETKRTFKCPLCPQTFLAPATLRTHMLIHEAEYEALERKNRFPMEGNKHWDKGHPCPECPCVFRDEKSLNSHLLSFHKSVAQYLENMAAAPPRKHVMQLNSQNVQGKWRSDNASMKSYKCSECGKTFRHRSVLELHMRIHSKDKPYQCKVCSKSFRFSSYLQQHLIIHTGKKPFKCPDCGKDFAFLQNMRTHQRLHQEKPFRCTSCRKGYSDEAQLQHHMLSHNGDKPHKCDLCDKSFGLAYLLRDHMNTHTGERPHRCDECHKTFSWFSSLLVHQKIHARKRQSFSQYNSLSAGARMRGRGNRGKIAGRPMWGYSRQLGSLGMVSSQLSLYPASVQKDAELHRRAVQPQSSMYSSQMDLQGRQQKEPWLSEQNPQPVQWKVDGGEVMPVPLMKQQQVMPEQTQFDGPQQPTLQQLHLRNPGWADNPSITQSGPASSQNSEPSHKKENAHSAVNSLLTAVPMKCSPLVVSEMGRLKPVSWSSTPTTTALASTSSLQRDFSVPSYIDGAALWSIRPALPATSQGSPTNLSQGRQLQRWPGAPVLTPKEPSTPKKEETRVWDMSNPQVLPSTVNQPEKSWNGCELQKQWTSGLAGASTSARVDQSSAMSIATPVSHGLASTLWDIQTPTGIPKTINSPEKLVNNHQDFQLQQKQVSSGWANVQGQAVTQKVPISIQYDPHRFAQGVGAPVWGFQSNPVGPQTLITGQLKPGNGQELQQQPIVTGTQIIINQHSPFFSPPLAPLPPLALSGPHPLHSVAVGALSRPPHPNIFFAPQAVMSERPHLSQTLPLPQLAPRTEAHKLGPRLPFTPERLLRCMICGCSFPREVDLQMHYLQHAQGEI